MHRSSRIDLKSFVAISALLLSLSFGTRVSRAQNTQAPNTQPGAARQIRIAQVEAQTLSTLDTLGTQTDVGAVSLSVSLAELRARPAALQALAAWVHSGGVVFLHTDAAQIFGYTTVAAREATARVAGQLFGRARAALPFAGHPLLWGSTTLGMTGAATTNTTGDASTPARAASSLGVRLVFYQMNPGDRLVLEHPAGVPLLQVTDLALPSNTPQYAAAIAPYGNGWAVFTPLLVEQHRADGAVFLQNLLRLMGSSPKVMARSTPAGAASTLTSLPAAFIESAAERVRQAPDGAFDAATLSRDLVAAWRPVPATMVADEGAGVQIPRADSVARLMLTNGELATLNGLINATAANAAVRPRVAAMLYLWRARLELQRSDLRTADAWLTLAEQIAPDAAEVALWRGVFQAGQAEDKMLDSRTRALLLNGAATRWTQAVGAATLTGAAAAPEVATETAAPATSQGPALSGIPVSLIRLWAASAATSARLLANEPPAITPLGTTVHTVALRHFPNDLRLRLVLPAAQAQSGVGSTLGWNVLEEEILLFPSAEQYEGYRIASGTAALGPSGPLTVYGDVAGTRILMASPFSGRITLPATPTQPARTLQMGSSTPAILARLHAHVLINALAGGGTYVPEWIQLGLMSLNNMQVQSELMQNSVSTDELGRLAVGGQLLSPAQFRGAPTRTFAPTLAEAQASRLLSFFYARYGAGRVAETLQRLGSGETIDEALDATIGMSESEFFTAWYNAEFGRR